MRPDAFAAHLRTVEVAPNGHANTARRRLRDKGIRFILETCRAMYNFALRRRHLPPYVGNPFLEALRRWPESRRYATKRLGR